MKNPTRHTQENPLTDIGIYFCTDRIILVNGPVGLKMIRTEMCIVSYRIVISDTTRYDTPGQRYDTIRYDTPRYDTSRYATTRGDMIQLCFRKRRGAIRYDTKRPQATTIRPANDTIRYEQRRETVRYDTN